MAPPEIGDRPEHRLLPLCATMAPREAAIRALVADGVDWTVLVQIALRHRVAPLLHRSLRIACPDLLPEDLAAAFQVHDESARATGTALVIALVELVRQFDQQGIPMIPFKGPSLGARLYGDPALRSNRDLDFLVHPEDTDAAIRALGQRGYRPTSDSAGLTAAQLARIRRIDGQEMLHRPTDGVVVEPHWSLTPDKFTVGIDYPGLWARTGPYVLGGQTIRVLAPEDELLVLALHGGKETWWRLNWICDIAELVRSHPELDWNLVFSRASAQGCRRMVTLALALAHRLLGVDLPASVARRLDDPPIPRLVAAIAARLFDPTLTGPPPLSVPSRLRFQVHDSAMGRIDYLLRTLLWPAERHVRMLALPRALETGYVAVRIIHDYVALPLWRLRPGRNPGRLN